MKVSDISQPTNATAMRLASSGSYRCVSTLSYTASKAKSATLTMSPPPYPMDEPFLTHPDPDETLKNAGPRPFSGPSQLHSLWCRCLFQLSLPLFPLRHLRNPYPTWVSIKNRW